MKIGDFVGVLKFVHFVLREEDRKVQSDLKILRSMLVKVLVDPLMNF